jgi:hypothetical protein
MMSKSSLSIPKTFPVVEPETASAVIGNAEVMIRRMVILAILYLLPAVWILQPVIIDPDIWWHVQTGKWIVEHGTLPTTDPFSVYGEGKPWIVYSWLFEVGMYGLMQVFGEFGIILYTLIGVWSIMLVLHRTIASRISDFVVVCGLLGLSVVALSGLFTPRPWLLTVLFFAVTLEVILSLREGKTSWWHWALPLPYVLWANTHIQFIYGLGLLGLACVSPILDQIAGPYTGSRSVMAWRSEPWKRLIIITVLCGLATLITPYHVYLYSVVVTYAGQTGFWEFIQEMQAPSFRSLTDWAMLGMFSFALIQLGRRSSWSLFEVLLIIAAGITAFRGQRDVWCLVLASLVMFFSWKPQENKRQWNTIPGSALVPICFLVAVGAVALLGWRDFSKVKIQENTAKTYPLGAAAFVEQHRYPGPLYNHFNWGGYLLWRLPYLKVSMDGRGNVHGEDRIKKALTTWNGGPHWADDVELNGAELVIAQKDMALAALLRLDPRFKVAYQDETAVVFTRTLQGKDQSNRPASEGSLPDPPIVDLASTRSGGLKAED